MATDAPAGQGMDTGTPAFQQLRRQLRLTLASIFVLVMVLAGPVRTEFGSQRDLMVGWLLLAAILPLVFALAARRILRPAEDMHMTQDRLRQLYGKARLDSLIDPISGLGNHRAFQEELIRQLEDARRHGHPVALALIDLDDLKRINDDRGHVGGDVVLATMGRLVMTACRISDRGFRIGGDEFAILLPRSDVPSAMGVARRLLAGAVSPEGLEPGAQAFSFSAGISAYPALASDARTLFKQADAALYWAKRHGRTDVHAFDPERHGAVDENRSVSELAEAVAHVIAHRPLTPMFQTVFDLRSGQPVGFEGLIRPSGEAEFDGAEQLFRAAETVERTVELDMACLEILTAAARLPDGSTYLALNVSPRTLETDQFHVTDLLAILRRHDIPPDRVVIELTEREQIGDVARLRENLDRCRAQGMRIAADDVGAGNAGLRLLSEISFDIVKIDLSLVQRGALRASAVAVLRAIREIGRHSGAIVVAEGIESAEQLEVVRSLDVPAGQGYLLAVPSTRLTTSALDIETMLAVHEASRRALQGYAALEVA